MDCDFSKDQPNVDGVLGLEVEDYYGPDIYTIRKICESTKLIRRGEGCHLWICKSIYHVDTHEGIGFVVIRQTLYRLGTFEFNYETYDDWYL